MKVLIIEDEAPAFRRLQKLLTEIDPSIEIVEVLDGVKDTVQWLNAHETPDLIFMDIQLNDGISFEIFDQAEVKKPVIFTTAFDEYMLKAFRVNSIDYLLKPIKQSELQRSLDKYRTLKAQLSNEPLSQPNIQELVKNIQFGQIKYKSRFLVKMGEKMMSVETEHIACFQANNGLVYLVSQSAKRYVIDMTLDEIMKELDPEKFYRVNRQFVLCYHCIAAVHKYGKSQLLVEACLPIEEQIIVSSEKASAFKQWLG
ncbi:MULTISPECIES: LytR/AlgR family response regulator transcription factor [Reichenbachiella]|uniref:Two component transcriptional regulator, LytTR family n=1 Tax=Reichenbachiella agariperforans TaxID=156994 RepID=A0A1M6TGK3_REIAG|nr:MULTISPECIES: LytTR family DNA-binding domain-containing protein [Reichenbachiella]MBU2915430.1 LytTR family DNA-binding domain-containing protein [Reichenbachiella agariperforans]RJE71503.1 DNA-binding response regulator [Reichenbachiella sp. MSK19-1]SHK56029.1 two component transcriptional regulator, LytTR family [Reichenbachiella agariperforans]